MSTANLNIVHVAPRTEFSFCFLYVIDSDIVHQELVARLGDGFKLGDSLAGHVIVAVPLRLGREKDELVRLKFTVSDFIATLNYHSHVEAEDYVHSLTPPLQICRT